MNKIKVLFCYLAYPFAIASYFRRALENRDDIELFTLGPYTGDFIPWSGGMRLPQKYVRPVDLPLPKHIINPTWQVIKSSIPWNPDVVITVDAGFYFVDKPDCGISAHVATDPHVLNYDYQRQHCDYFFNMQKFYSKEGDIYLPYAADLTCHYPDDTVSVDHECCLIGLQYPQRNHLVTALRDKGCTVIYRIGPIYDEYRQQNCRAKIGLNWSSLQDLNARVFEIMAMGRIPVINRVPDLAFMFEEDRHYLGFSTLGDAITKVEWALANENEARIIAMRARDKVCAEHTYDLRIQFILEKCGVI